MTEIGTSCRILPFFHIFSPSGIQSLKPFRFLGRNLAVLGTIHNKEFQVGLGTEALLEVLDPEQNSSFRDHYLDVSCSVSSGFHQIFLNTG